MFQRSLIRITHEHHQLTERLKDESTQKEQLRNLKNEMESERWQLDKTVEKLHKEVYVCPYISNYKPNASAAHHTRFSVHQKSGDAHCHFG